MNDRDPALANLRIEVSALAAQIGEASVPRALGSVRRTVVMAAIMISASLIASAAIRACVVRDVEDLRMRVERLEARSC